MPSDTPVKNPSNLTLNQEGRRRKLRQKRAVSRLRAYSVGMLEDGLGYVSSQLNRSMLPHKSITKFTTVSGEDFLRESSADIINLIQYCDDVKAGRTAAVPDPTLTTKADTNNGDTNGKHDEYIKEAEVRERVIISVYDHLIFIFIL
jgi:hypothetical protein